MSNATPVQLALHAIAVTAEKSGTQAQALLIDLMEENPTAPELERYRQYREGIKI